MQREITKGVVMHNVVFRTIVKCTHTGVITWSSFSDKKSFDKWYDKKMRSWYEVVIQGVSEEEAIRCCSTPEANLAGLVASLREINKHLKEFQEAHPP